MNTTPYRFAASRFYLVIGLLALAGVSAFAQVAPSSGTTDSSSAGAQSESPVVLDAYTVHSGFSGSLAAAAEAKMQMIGVTEVIAAEDIGKLPDISIADSLTRLTGLTAQRTNGRSQQISIRGLNGDFSTGTLNGLEQTSTDLNRRVEFDQYPAELLSAVVVYKTAAADLTTQGLAGTIDMRTVQPLSHSRRAVAVSGNYEWTQYGRLTPGLKKTGDRLNVSYVDQYLGGKLGLAFGFSHSDTPYTGEQFQGYGYNTDTAGNLALSGEKSYVRASNLARDGFMSVVEYKPTDFVHSTLNLFFSKFKETQLLRGMETPLVASFTNTKGTNLLQPGYTVENGLVTMYTVTNVQPVIRNDFVSRHDSPLSIGWNLRLGEQSAWPISFDAGYSRVGRKDVDMETYSGLGFNKPASGGDTWTVHSIPGKVPVITTGLDYTNPAPFMLTNPQGYAMSASTISDGYLKYLQSKDELGQVKVSVKHELSRFFRDIELGASYVDRYKRDGEWPSGSLYQSNLSTTAPLPPLIGVTDMSFLGIKGIYAYDPEALLHSGQYSFALNNSAGVIANRWQVYEKLFRPYAQLDIDTKLGSIPVTGNLGLQAVRADQSSDGLSATGKSVPTASGAPNNLNVLPVSGGATYTDFAPSLNLTFKLTSHTLVRFGLARQLARPRMYDMRAARSFSYNDARQSSTTLDQSPWSASGGNPALRPWRANSVDLSLEHYFRDNMGYVSLAGWSKQLLTYIYQQNEVVDFTGYPYSSAQPPLLNQGINGTPVNGAGGSIRGIEATVSLPSELISKRFRGFGVVMGGAYTDSSIQPWGPGNGTAPIAGLSRKVANFTAYYEHGGFSARISQRYRSENRAYITNFGPPNFTGDVNPNGGFSVQQPEKIVDAQIAYAMKISGHREVRVYIQAYNLTNEPLITYKNNDARQIVNYQKYGASYSLGAALKF